MWSKYKLCPQEYLRLSRQNVVGEHYTLGRAGPAFSGVSVSGKDIESLGTENIKEYDSIVIRVGFLS